jgi:hypothetical protein
MRDIFIGIKNLFVWFKIIWNDRWWDHYFFFIILHKKLSIMEKNFRKNGSHSCAEQDADKIKKCVLVIERLIKDNYDEISYWKGSLKEKGDHADYQRKQDIDYLFKILRKNILTWWD